MAHSNSYTPERPSPPVNLNSSNQTQSSVQLTWEPPLDDGGSPILGYIIERREEGKDNWIRCNMKPVPELTYKVGHLHLKHNIWCMTMDLNAFFFTNIDS